MGCESSIIDHGLIELKSRSSMGWSSSNRDRMCDVRAQIEIEHGMFEFYHGVVELHRVLPRPVIMQIES
eukprot:91901-Pyramimonas_sp.AAC.1